MNANELADCLEDDDWYNNPFANKAAKQAATMLRQQQAEIEALKAKTLTDEEIEQVGKETMLLQFFQSIEATAEHGDSVARAMTAMIRQQAFDFARAILKKAQEK